jgi:hypothetical protein
MLSCRESTELMSQARERPLTLRERVALNLHWAMCAACRRFDRQMDVLREAARRFAARADKASNADDDAQR